MIYTNFQRTFCELKRLFLELYINNNKGVSYYIFRNVELDTLIII